MITGKNPPVWNQTEVMYSALVFLSAFSLNMFSSTLVSYCETFLNMDTGAFSALVMMWTLESAICLGIVQPALVREVGEIATLQLSFLCMIVFYVLFCLLTPENSAWASRLRCDNFDNFDNCMIAFCKPSLHQATPGNASNRQELNVPHHGLGLLRL